MNKVWVAILAGTISGVAAAQSTELYQPVREIKDQGIAIKSWGSGTISETDETAFQGTHSIRISTRNFFQGGIMNFGNPVDLSKDYLSKSNLLEIVFKSADNGVMNAGGGKGNLGVPGRGRPGGIGGPGNQGGGGGGFGSPRGGGGAGPGGLGGPGGQGVGRGGPGGSGATEKAVLKTLRFIITTTDGLKSEAYVPADTSSTSQEWTTIAIPLQAISGFDRTNKMVKSIGISGNSTATFYVGDLKVVDDTTPIHGDPNVRDLNCALGDEYTLTASGSGGASILKYTWDFDDRDGIQVDAEGQSINHRFRKAGNYVITLTISDYYGLKQPYSTTIRVTVNP